MALIRSVPLMAMLFLWHPVAAPFLLAAGEPIDVEKIKQSYWSICEDDSRNVVQNRNYPKRNRLELSLLTGRDFGDRNYSTYLYGGSLGYHLSENYSLHLVGWQATHPDATFPEYSGARIYNHNYLDTFLGTEFRANILYGKWGVVGWDPIRYDLFLTLGAGALTTDSGTHVAGTAGIANRFPISSWAAFNFDLKLMAYRDKVIETRAGQTRAVGEQIDSPFKLNGQVTVGLSVFLDPFPRDEKGCAPPDFTPPRFKFPGDKLSPTQEPQLDEKKPEQNDKSLVTASTGAQNTSDGIFDRALTLKYRNHRRDPSWHYEDENEEGLDFGAGVEAHEGENDLAGYKGRKISLTLGWKISDSAQVDVSAGNHWLQNIELPETRSRFTPEIDVSVSPFKGFDLNVIGNEDYVYQELMQPAGVTEFLSARSVFLNAFFNPEIPLRFSSRNSFREFSDTNAKTALDFGALYGLSTNVPWIWLGAGVEYESYHFRRTGYWSPERFLGIGPRFEADFPFSDNFSGAIALNISYSQEDSLPWNFGYYGYARLRYGQRETFHTDLSYTRIHSLRASSPWYQNALLLEVGAPF